MEQWKKNLAPSQISFMQAIIDQVPMTMGSQAAFIEILNKIGTPPKPKPVVFQEGEGM